MSTSAPSIPLFGDAYLADTRHLSLEEHGAYLQLMMIAWRSADCALPDDDVRLARMLGISAGRWAKIKGAVMAFWTLGETGWTQKRLSKERAFVEEKRTKNKSAANSRWNNQPIENKQRDECERISKRNAPPPPPNRREEEERGKPLSKKKFDFACPDGVDADHWRDFRLARKRKGAVETETAYRGVLRHLSEFSNELWPPGRLVQRSAEMGWGRIVNPNEQDQQNETGTRNNPQLQRRRLDPSKDIDAAARALGFD